MDAAAPRRNLTLLAAGDLHGNQGGLDWLLRQARGLAPNLVVFLGDFVTGRPAEFVIEALRDLRELDMPAYVVPGNWDPRQSLVYFDEQAYDGLRNLHKGSAYLGGYSFAGLGGSTTTPSGGSPLESPDEGFAEPLRALLPASVWVLHNPLHGFCDISAKHGHVGSQSLRAMYDEQEYKPLLVLSGHIHEAAGHERDETTTFVNPGPLSDRRAALVRMEDAIVQVELVRGG